MEVSYESRQLELECTNQREMRKKHQPAIAKALQLRIKQLEAARGLADLTTSIGKWHPLTARGPGVYAGHLNANWRLVVCLSGDDITVAAAATVVSIEDYH